MSTIETYQSLEGFFSGLLAEALSAERVELSSSARAYLVQVASDYGATETLCAASRHGERGTPGLVWLYEEAAQARPSLQFDAFRRLGDTALVVGGFYAPHIERSLVDMSYYVGMGAAAYGRCATLAELKPFQLMFEQLATTFSRIVEVFTRVAEKTTLPVARDLGSLYERWLRSPDSGALSERLMGLGYVPITRRCAA